MVRWLLLAWGLLPSLAFAAELSIEPLREQVEWGRYVSVDAQFTGEGDPGEIDVSPWANDFHVERISRDLSKNELGETVAKERLRLYPRRIGVLDLSPLSLAGARSRSRQVLVDPPSLRKHSIAVQYQTQAHVVSVGEQVWVEFTLYSSDERSSVVIDLPEDDRLRGKQFSERTRDLTGQTPRYRHSVAWALFANKAGHWKLSLPPVRYQVSGSDVRRFYLPLLSLDVRPIPPYVPPTVAVGQLQLISERKDSGWRVTARANSDLPLGLPELRAQLAQISGQPVDEIAQRKRILVSDSGMLSKMVFDIPAPNFLSAWGTELRVQQRYFDTGAGRIQQAVVDMPRFWHVQPEYRPWVIAVAIISLIGFLISIRVWIQQLWRQAHAHWQLRSANSIPECRKIVLIACNCRVLPNAYRPARDLDRLVFAKPSGKLDLADARRLAGKVIRQYC